MKNLILNEQYTNCKFYFNGGRGDKIFIGKKNFLIYQIVVVFYYLVIVVIFLEKY